MDGALFSIIIGMTVAFLVSPAPYWLAAWISQMGDEK